MLEQYTTLHLLTAGMRRLEDLISGTLPPLAVTIGVFDGVHRGHQALIAATRRLAEERSAIPAALTFDPHPAALFAPGHTPQMLGTLPERVDLLHSAGLEQVIVARFDRAFASLSPEAFIYGVLLDRLNVRAVVVGEDFRFGDERAGDVDTLRAAGSEHGFAVEIIPPVLVDGVPARSTTIRQFLTAGRVEEAARLLGRPYTLRGEVVHGRQLGRTLGFPTANVASAPGVLVPGAGVYAARVYLESGEPPFRAAVSVGTNPTITPEGETVTVEAYLRDGFDRDLYGQRIGVEFHHYLRGMERFDGLEALIQQMHRDVAETERLLPSLQTAAI